ncbi:phosphatase PAP2 family protein [Cellulomonas sp. HZM]|uniref:phosphatase PAP2 family protein n=1 Tax=Cellulomonas sp. HZM TaxID=1454010 RepID=UPI0004935576|nr:phosphatase PAP2 family protein [Cellulomonas sp. HZM]
MSTFVHRYELDTTRPTFGSALRDVALRGLVPAAVVWCVVVGLGLLITGPLDDLPREKAVNDWFVSVRTPTMNDVTAVVCEIGNTPIVVALAVLTFLLLWWRTRQWWFAVVPPLAIGLQAAVFLTSSLLVGRERPDVDHLDDAPPTSSYPSGHTGASTALYTTLLLVAQRVRTPWLRVLLSTLCVLAPIAMGSARLYRGMHALSDVLVGLANGVVCALIAWGYLRRDVSRGEVTPRA